MSSTRVKLEKVCDVIRGVTFKPEDLVPPFTENSIVVMRTKNVQVRGLDYEDLISIPLSLVNDKKRVLVDGDLLISSANSWYLVGKTSFFETNKLASSVTAGGFISIIRPKSSIESKYLYHWITTDKSQHKIRHLGRQTTNISNLDFNQFKKLEIPLPPLPEQQRIADILDKAEAINQKREQALALCDEFLRATFLNMFGDPVSNPKGWEVTDLERATNKITDGTHHSPPITDEGIPYITAKHLKKDGLRFFDNPWYISLEDHKNIFSRCNPEKGDVLYIKDGATTGIAAINEYDFEFSMLSSLALIKCDKGILNPYFLCSMLNNDRNKQKLISNMGGAAIKRLTLTKIKKIEIIVPPIELQQKFSEIVENVNGIKKRIQQAQELPLFDALSQQAFKGELTQ